MRIEDFYSRTGTISDEKYHDELKRLQFSLLLLQQAYFRQKRRGVIVFEGWDAAGKGGTIKRMVEGMDPRGFRVHQVGAPTPEEQGRHYLYRFWMNLPKSGRLAIFDRSWYGRVLVERVEKLATTERVRAAFGEINQFEKTLTDDGIAVCKVFLDISKKEQIQRMKKRYSDPEKCWKLTTDDFRNLELRDAYAKSIVDMLKETSSKHAPWFVFDANDKQTARIEVLRKVLKVLGKDVDLTVPAPDPEIRRLAKVYFK